MSPVRGWLRFNLHFGVWPLAADPHLPPSSLWQDMPSWLVERGVRRNLLPRTVKILKYANYLNVFVGFRLPLPPTPALLLGAELHTLRTPLEVTVLNIILCVDAEEGNRLELPALKLSF